MPDHGAPATRARKSSTWARIGSRADRAARATADRRRSEPRRSGSLGIPWSQELRPRQERLPAFAQVLGGFGHGFPFRQDQQVQSSWQPRRESVTEPAQYLRESWQALLA